MNKLKSNTITIDTSNYNQFNQLYFHHPVEVHYTEVIMDTSKGYPEPKSVPTSVVKKGKILYTTNGICVTVLLDSGDIENVYNSNLKLLPKEE